MRKPILLLAATAAATMAAGAATAQVWSPMIERQAAFEDHVDAGLRAGDLTTAEARDLRADMASLVALEGRYRWGGLSARERLDLDRRFAALDDQLRVELRPVAGDRWTSMEDRKLELEARINAGVRSGQLTSAEAADLRDDFDAIAATEAHYRIDGLSAAERADLDRRFDALSERIHLARADDDRVYGLNRYPPPDR
jgi:hypothetical protein